MNHIIFLTTFNRLELLKQTLESLWKTLKTGTPIFIINDGGNQETRDYLHYCLSNNLIASVIDSRINMGITPSIDTGIYYISNFVRFWNADRRQNIDPFVSYIQDDMKFIKEDWPTYCIEKYNEACKHIKQIDFITGFDFSYSFDENNHSRIYKEINIPGCHFRESASGQHLMGLLSTWKERTPIPTYRKDGNRDVLRGHPHNGMGSCVDWWIVRDYKPCKILCVEDIAVYEGKKKSTWQVY